MTLGLVGSAVVIAVGSVAIAAIILGIVWMVRTMLRTPDLSSTAKTIWTIAFVAAPILSAIAWFIFSNSRAHRFS